MRSAYCMIGIWRQQILMLLFLANLRFVQMWDTVHFLTSNRPQEITFGFPHFTPFEDMNCPRCRAQRMGMHPMRSFEDRTKIEVWPNVFINLTEIIRIYIEEGLQRSQTTEFSIELHKVINKTTTVNGAYKDHFVEYLVLHPSSFTLMYQPDSMFRMMDVFRSDHIQKTTGPPFLLGMKAWRLLALFAISSNPALFFKVDGKKVRVPVSYTPASEIHDDWSLVFIDEYCQVARNHYSSQIRLPNGFCPNPCLGEPCVGMQHTSSTKCIPTGTKWYEFECICQPSFKWIRSRNLVGHCQSKERCTGYCDPEGTRRCDVIQEKEFCVCRPTHMGPTCSTKRDPCLELSSPSDVPGNVSCNVANGGRCIGVLGTNTYSCICPAAYTSDPSYSLPNCMAFKDNCLSRICLRGDCISSKDGQETYCLCPDEAYGEYCELIRGKWAQWSPWSECSPNCGMTEFQKRIRTRDCLGEACRGGEGHLQMELCPTIPCPDETLALARQGRSEEVSELKIQLLQAQAARYVKLVGAVAQALILISCIFAGMAVTAMAVRVHLM